MKTAPVSFLMSTYIGDNLIYLQDSVSSILKQTIAPREVVIVLDGEIKRECKSFLMGIASNTSQIEIKIVEQENAGLAGALNNGLTYCTQPFIARMDSDDICYPDRLEKQIKYMENKDLDLVASWHEEFTESDKDFHRIKKCPEDHKSIVKVLRFRNPISHPSLLVKAEVLKEMNGYSVDMVPFEDYDLYYRLIAAGFQLGCMQEPIVKVRVTGQMSRRSTFKYIKTDFKLKYRAFRSGNYGIITFIVGFCLLVIFRLTPLRLKTHIYKYLRN